MKAVRLLEAALFAVCCSLGAGLVTTWLDAAPAPASRRLEAPHPIDDPRRGWADRRVILDRNLFQVSTLLPATPPVAEIAPDEEQLSATRLPLRLLGTVASAGAAGAFAAIEDQQTHRPIVARAGDVLRDAATVLRIERRRIVIQNGAAREELALDDAAAPGQQQVRAVRVARSAEAAAAAMSQRIQKLSETTFARKPTASAPPTSPSETQIAPRFEQGQLTGVQLSSIERGSVFEDLGIREGDTVTQVNGIVATNHQDSIALLRELTEASDLQVNVTGVDGAVRTLTRTAGN